MKDLKNNATDYVAMTLKGLSGIIPFAGTAIGEAMTVFLPGQRLDRFARYLQELNEKIEHLNANILKERLSDIERVELLNEGAIHASRAISDERRTYFANLVSHCITEEKIDFSKQMHLMRILSDINDIEVIVLRFYLYEGKDGDTRFREKHKNTYDNPKIFIDSTDDDTEKAAIQMSYRIHLASLALLHQTNVIDSKVDMIMTTNPRNARYEITGLGKLLLKNIGLHDSFEEIPNKFF